MVALFLLLGSIVFCGPLIAFIVLFVRLSSQGQRIEALSSRLASLEAARGAVPAQAAMPASASVVGPLSPSMAAAQPGSPSPSAAPSQPLQPALAAAQAAPLPRAPAEPAASVGAAEPSASISAPASPSAQAPAAPFAQAPRAAEPAPERKVDAEQREAFGGLFSALRRNWLAAIGAGLLLLGVAFLFPLLVEHGFFPPILRVFGAGILGAALLGGGQRLSRSKPEYAQVLQGAGASVLYLTVYGSMSFYELISTGVGFALFALLSAGLMALSHRQNGQALAFLGFFGAFLAPILTANGSDNPHVLLLYGLLVNAASLWVAWDKRWLPLAGLSLILSAAFGEALRLAGAAFPLSLALGLGSSGPAPLWLLSTTESQGFLTAYAALFVLFPTFFSLRHAPLNRWEHHALSAMGALALFATFAFELAVGGREGLCVAAAAFSLFYFWRFFVFSADASMAERGADAGLFVASLLAAIASPAIPLAPRLALAAVLAVALHAFLPGRLRALSAAPALLVAGFLASSDAVWSDAATACAMFAAIGLMAAFRGHREDVWAAHPLAALCAALSVQELFSSTSSFFEAGLAVEAALALGVGMCCAFGFGERRRSWSAMASFAAAGALFLLGALVSPPVSAALHGLRLFGVAGLLSCAFAFVQTRPNASLRVVFVFIFWILAGFLGDQFFLGDARVSAHFDWASWMALGLVGSFVCPPVSKWLAADPFEDGFVVAIAALGITAAIQWIEVAVGWKPAHLPLSALWMALALSMLASFATKPLRLAAVSLALAAFASYALDLADLRFVVTLAWAAIGLLSLVWGSRSRSRALWIAGAGLNVAVVAKLILFDMSMADPIWRVLSFIGCGALFLLAGYLAPAPFGKEESKQSDS
jgi:uncharacterized membrane protein